MNFRLCLCFLALSYVLSAQQKVDQTADLVSKGRFFVGLSSDLSFGFSTFERRFILPAKLQPKIGYFIADRLSLGFTYQGTGISSTTAPRYLMYHRGLLELNYYFYSRKNILLYSQTGLAFEQYGTPNYYHQKHTDISLKLGAGISWRLKANPNIGFHLEAAHYLGRGMPLRNFPDLSIGMSYFFHKKKAAKTLLQP